MRKVIHAELYAPGTELEKLLADWSSCVRFAYNRFREGLDFNAVRKACKEKYPSLNTRQISDAVTEQKANTNEPKTSTRLCLGEGSYSEKSVQEKFRWSSGALYVME
jgi:hypothetical protein